jgi:hypothetical protein
MVLVYRIGARSNPGAVTVGVCATPIGTLQ